MIGTAGKTRLCEVKEDTGQKAEFHKLKSALDKREERRYTLTY